MKVVLARNAEHAAWMVGYVLKKQVEVTSLHFLLPDDQRLDCSTDAYARLEEHSPTEDGGVILSCGIFLQTELPGWPDEYEDPPPEVERSLKVVFAA